MQFQYQALAAEGHGQPLLLNNEHLVLLPEKAIWWPAQSSLLLADVHLGKAAHFRKAGIPIPKAVHLTDYHKLEKLLSDTQAKHVIFLGDLFHSELNLEWADFLQWVANRPETNFILVKGNHDILPEAAYIADNLNIYSEKLEIKPFLLTHQPEPIKARQKGLYNLCGHLHPAIALKGAARQGITLPCFYFGLHGGLLPAFGNFTGFSKISVKQGDAVFGITPTEVIPIPTA